MMTRTRERRARLELEDDAPAPELPRVARLWPELAGVPFDRVVAQALAEAPLHQSHVLVLLPAVLPGGP